MKDNKKKTLLFMLLVISILFSYLPAKLLTLKMAFGEDNIYVPEQIFVPGNEVYIHDEGDPFNISDDQIKVFSLEGDFKTAIGRAGEGPGEFKGIFGVYVLEKKIFVLDQLGNKLHIFSTTDKKWLESKRMYFPNIGNSVRDFVVNEDGTVFYTLSNDMKGEKSIFKLDADMKMVKSFRDCFPLYENLNEMRGYARKQKTPQEVRNNVLNSCFMAASGKKLYINSFLLNKIEAFSLDGEFMGTCTLPLESIDKTAPIIQVREHLTIERRLNYDMKWKNDRLFVLSWDKNGDSVIFELDEKAGKFNEKYRVKEKLYGFDLAADRLYGIENEEARVLVYNLK